MPNAEESSLLLVQEAAARGVAEAEAIYGQMLLDGKLLPPNATLALHYFERAALHGSLMAMNMVGRCLDQGWGVQRSPHLAAPWFRKAAEAGLDWGMYNWATLLILGNGVPKDLSEALYWLRRAVELKHAKSMNILGGFYEDEWVVAKNMQEAQRLYLQSAQGGDFRGQFNLGRVLAMQGDTAGALVWLRQVPETATPAFLQKAKSFLEQWPVSEVRVFAASLPGVPGVRAGAVSKGGAAFC